MTTPLASNASVTMPIAEYQKATSGAPTGVVCAVAVVAFGIGLITGMQTIDQPDRKPTTPPVVQTSVPPQRTAPPIIYHV